MPFSTILEKVILYHLSLLGENSKTRTLKLASRTYFGRPVLDIDDGDLILAPSPLVDKKQYTFLNRSFSNILPKDTILIPLPMNGRKAAVYNIEGVKIIVINEYELMYAEYICAMALNAHGRIPNIPDIIQLFGNLELDRKINKLVSTSSSFPLNHGDDLHEILIARMAIENHIRENRELVPDLKKISAISYDMISPSICECSTGIGKSWVPDSILFHTNTRISSSDYDAAKRYIYQMMFGYVYAIVSHEVSHVVNGHVEGRDASFAWEMINHSRLPGLENAMAEFEADVTAVSFWRDAIEGKGFGDYEFHPYIGMILCYAVDYVRVVSENSLNNDDYKAAFYNWVGSEMGRTQSEDSLGLIDTHPTEVERFNINVSLPILCACLTGSGPLVAGVLVLSAAMMSSYRGFAANFNATYNVTLGCQKCNDASPIVSENMLKRRIEKYNKLPAQHMKQKEEEFNLFFSDFKGAAQNVAGNVSNNMRGKIAGTLRDMFDGEK